MFLHPGEFDHATQLDLAPPAAHLGRAQGLHEAPRLGPQLLLPFGEGRQVRRELASLLLPAGLDGGQGLLDLVQGGAHGIEHRLDPLLALGQVVLRVALEGLEPRRGEVEEPPGVRVQAGRRQRLEGPLEPLLGVLVDRQPLGVRAALRLQRRLQAGPFLDGRQQVQARMGPGAGLGRRHLVPGRRAGGDPAERARPASSPPIAHRTSSAGMDMTR